MAELRDLPNQRSTGVMSTPTSPKTKSAPTTPCSVTPTAFHQHTSHMNSQQIPSQASTLPPDIRRNMTHQLSTTHPNLLKTRDVQEDQEQVTLSTSNATRKIDEKLLDELIRYGDSSLDSKNYEEAVKVYSNCIELAESSKNERYLGRVYIQRAEANFELENYNEAKEDSIRAREINPKCTRAYCLQGKSQFLLGQHADSLAVFSFALAQDPSNEELFEELVRSALDSDFQDVFKPRYNTLNSMNLEKEPFVVVAVLGQELLLLKIEHAAIILESALKIGTDDKKMKSSVLSTISYAYCIMKKYEKAVAKMQEELLLESELADVNGQCRVLANLGYTYYKMQRFDESLDAHRKQVSLAMRNCLFPKVSRGLNALGHVHMAKNDFVSALTSHTRCLEILRPLGNNNFNQFKELLSIGHIHTMLGDYKAAKERYTEVCRGMESGALLDRHNPEEYRIGNIMINFNLAYLELKKQKFNEAKKYYSEVLELAKELPDQQQALIKTRASTGINHTHNLLKKSLNCANELEMA